MPLIKHILSRKLERAGYLVCLDGGGGVELTFGLLMVGAFTDQVRIETLRKVAEADFRQRKVKEVAAGLVED